ncbi:MAG: CAP domain-containing protein [bacterium]|nr:CAP domain-containing protein [bacterium]
MSYLKGVFLVFLARKKIINSQLSLFKFIFIGIFLYSTFLPKTVQASAVITENIFASINNERKKISLNDLTINPLLNQAAAQKAHDILSQERFAHNFPDMKFSDWVKETGYEYSVVGENLAINFTNNDTLFNAWLSSPSHKKNIIHPDFNEVGLAVVEGSWFNNNTSVVVAIFASPKIVTALEQTVPTTLASKHRSYSPPLLTSNLAENYYSHINSNTIELEFAGANPIVLSEVEKNNTATTFYFVMAAKVMLIFMFSMLMLMSILYYSYYFSKLNKKIQLLNNHP